MNRLSDQQLLREYLERQSESAFAGLVTRHIDFVYSAARRMVCDAHLAQDVTQGVFVALARNARQLADRPVLAGWLHRTAQNIAAQTVRTDVRRRAREQEAAAMNDLLVNAPDSSWDDIAPHLDDALGELNESDRDALLLRYFERRSAQEIAQTLGISGDAAQKRVSRAVERLREFFARRGVGIGAGGLVVVLSAQGVQAAPMGLAAAVSAAARLAVPMGAGAAGSSSTLLQMLKSKSVLGTTAACAVIITALILLPSKETRRNESPSVAQEQEPAAPSDAASATGRAARRAGVAPDAAAEVQAATRFIFRVVDKETQAGLAGVKIHAAYFYAGGVGEAHELQTDAKGNAPIPEQNYPDRKVGLNVFASIEGHVPKVVNFHGTEARTNYVLEMEPALAAGGVVVDEQGLPVAGAELQGQRRHDREGSEEDFQMCKVTTDADGRWFFPYVPQSYSKMEFYATVTNYAVTLVSVPMGTPDSLNATIVLERGYTVAGRVTDAQGQPVPGVQVKERHNFGFRKLSTTTDRDGWFALPGVGIPVSRTVNFSDPMKPIISSGKTEQKMDISIQLQGMASQLRTVSLVEPTNYVNFVLAAGNIFRGRVVDDAGHAIGGAVVRTDYDFEHQVPSSVDWQTTTDADGRFEWDSAPKEPLCFWFEADGYEIIRSRVLPADGTDHEIKLKPRGLNAKSR